MKRTCLFMLIPVLLFICSCKSGGTDAEIATDMCGCFNMIKDSFPKEAIPVFEKAAVAADPKETFGSEMQKIDPENAMKVSAVLMSTGRPGTPINDCLKALDKKYKTPATSDEDAAKRMVAALKDKKGCDIMMALMRMNLKK